MTAIHSCSTKVNAESQLLPRTVSRIFFPSFAHFLHASVCWSPKDLNNHFDKFQDCLHNRHGGRIKVHRLILSRTTQQLLSLLNYFYINRIVFNICAFYCEIVFYSVSYISLAIAYTKLARNYRINFSLASMHSEIQFELTPQHF